MIKTILVTGCAGFIGSNFVSGFLKNNPEIHIVNLDILSYAASTDNLKGIKDCERHIFIKGNICDRKLVESIFSNYDIRGVIHFAAESHVDNSIRNPEVFMQTNVMGTFTLMDVAFKYWMEKPFTPKDSYEECRFHHISTDEVYGSLGKTGLFTETTSYAPNSPYSASKASSDMIVRSYHHTFGMNTVVTNCSNNYGPRQHDEKFIPTIIRHALAGKPIPIYGDGTNIRDWLFVNDHCSGVELAYKFGKSGNVYNIGGNNERSNLDIVNTICGLLNKMLPPTSNKKIKAQQLNIVDYKELITFVPDRAGHDHRYAIDASKIETELGWRANEHFESGIVKTIEWYMEKYYA